MSENKGPCGELQIMYTLYSLLDFCNTPRGGEGASMSNNFPNRGGLRRGQKGG
jgi:hypothetical protein